MQTLRYSTPQGPTASHCHRPKRQSLRDAPGRPIPAVLGARDAVARQQPADVGSVLGRALGHVAAVPRPVVQLARAAAVRDARRHARAADTLDDARAHT